MPQNAPQCPIFNDEHDTLSSLPSNTNAPPPSPKGANATPSPTREPPVGEGRGEGSSEPTTQPAPPADDPSPAPLASSHPLSNSASAPTPQDSALSTQDSPTLPDRQLAAIELLVLGHRDTAVAAALGIDRKTLYRWRHLDPAFADHLERRRKELLDSTSDRFRLMLTDALDTFARQLTDPYAPTAHRAARSLLALASIGRPRHPSPPPNPQPLTTDHGQRTTDQPGPVP